MTTRIIGGTGIEFPDATQQGTRGVPNDAPVFDVYASADLGVSTGTPTKSALDSPVINVGGGWDATNQWFKPNVHGIYLLVTRMRGGASTALFDINSMLYKNGELYTRTAESFHGLTFQGSCLVELNGTTDYVELYGSVSGTGSLTQAVAGSSIGWYGPRFSGHLVRAL